jgi:hypothetical protein
MDHSLSECQGLLPYPHVMDPLPYRHVMDPLTDSHVMVPLLYPNVRDRLPYPHVRNPHARDPLPRPSNRSPHPLQTLCKQFPFPRDFAMYISGSHFAPTTDFVVQLIISYKYTNSPFRIPSFPRLPFCERCREFPFYDLSR